MHNVGARRKSGVLASNLKRLERLLRKAAKEDDDAIDYKRLVRTENKVERLKRKQAEQANMDRRERIEREIISTDPSKYLNALTEE